MSETLTAPPPATSNGLSPAARKRRRRRRIWLGLGVATVVGLVALSMRPKPVPPTVVTIEKAAQRDITQLVSANGKVQPEVEVKISPEVAGEIIELPVKVGQPVKKGDLLIKIKPDTYLAQVEQQEAGIKAAKAANLQNRAQMMKLESDLKRAEQLFSQRITSDADIATARMQFDVSKATFEASASEIARAESALRQTRDLLQKTTIISPIDGVISVLNSQLGERVVATGQFAGTEVMRVADFSVMEIRVQVNENDIPRVKMGDPVAVNIDAFPGRPFRGTVSQIANSATTTGAGTQEEVTNFEVRVRIDAQGAALRPGMSGTADVETQTVKGAVAVALPAVTIREKGATKSPEEREKEKAQAAAADKGDNATELYNDKQQAQQKKAERERSARVVFVRTGNKVVQREVEIGIDDNNFIEIKKGLKPGEEVVTGPYKAVSRTLKEGSAIKLEEPLKPAK